MCFARNLHFSALVSACVHRDMHQAEEYVGAPELRPALSNFGSTVNNKFEILIFFLSTNFNLQIVCLIVF